MTTARVVTVMALARRRPVVTAAVMTAAARRGPVVMSATVMSTPVVPATPGGVPWSWPPPFQLPRWHSRCR